MINEMLVSEITKTFRAVTINNIASSPPLTAIKNRNMETVIEFCIRDGIVYVDFTSHYSNTRKKLNVKTPVRRSAVFDPYQTQCFSRPRIKSKMYTIASPTFMADFMREIGRHIRKNQPRGTRTPYSQKAKDRHTW